MDKLKIVMIGAGNLAYHLSKALSEANHQILQVFSRTISSAEILAKQICADAICDLKMLDHGADLYIIAASDMAIAQIVEQFDFNNKRVVHTAGSVPISVFNSEIQNSGVFYPLQSFSKARNVNFKEVPICIESNNQQFELFLMDLAKQLSESTWCINSIQRKQLHLSAVFANNFVNHLYFIANEIISKANIDFKILHPLIIETAHKLLELGPKSSQTGPALRNDTESLKKHLELLSSTPEYQDIYKIITDDIYLKHNSL